MINFLNLESRYLLNVYDMMWTRVVFALFLISYASNAYGNEETAVIILARGGSKGIPLKNLKTVGGVSLLTRAILTAQQAGFTDITVSTDHILIALEAWKNGVNVTCRSPVTASDWAPSIWGVSEFISTRPKVTTVVLMQATSPFTPTGKLINALNKLNHPIPYDCIFSTLRSYKLRWNRINDKFVPINFKNVARPRRQDWDGEYLETGAFYISRRHLIEKGYLQNEK